jgi:elongation factor G
VTVPFASVGDITGHFAAIRGKIAGTDALAGGRSRVHALVPLAELGDYAATLKSLTGGEGVFTLEFDHYSILPSHLQKALVEAFKPHPDE